MPSSIAHRISHLRIRAARAHALGEPQPEREAALAFTRAVVILDAVDPHAPEGGVLALGEDERVLDGDARLVIEAVQHPALELAARELAPVHALVEDVVVVV